MVHRRVGVFFRVSPAMMDSMMRGPPERSSLRRCIAQHRARKLKPTACLESPMREIAMIKRRQTKNPREESPRQIASAVQLQLAQYTARQATCMARNGQSVRHSICGMLKGEPPGLRMFGFPSMGLGPDGLDAVDHGNAIVHIVHNVHVTRSLCLPKVNGH